jgi:DNA-binding NtrC family response regulator
LKPRKLLVVDDIPEVKDFLVEALSAEYTVRGVGSAEDALHLLRKDTHDVLITDVAMPDMTGEWLIGKIREMGIDIVTIAITAYGTVESATRLMRMGVYDYIEKPFTIDRIVHTIEKAFEYGDLKKENAILQHRLRDQDKMKSLVGSSEALQNVREKIRLVAATKATLLLTGESGTGKEVAAREIHRLSDRQRRPFIKINCASIPETLLESELFGHERGAFTGAVRSVPGKFELANSGTILLDEIGEMSATIQAKLLRVIQEGEFDRVGGTKPIRVDVRIIATTNRNLRKEIQKGTFREDLFYRLNVVPIELPPLRERREDIPLLITHFIDSFSNENGKPAIHLTDGAIDRLCSAYWRGNVRELENVIERAVILAGGATLDADYFQFEDDREERLSRIEQTFRTGSIRDMERLMILSRLTENEQNRTKAARTLEISVRTLRNKLRDYRGAAIRGEHDILAPPPA